MATRDREKYNAYMREYMKNRWQRRRTETIAVMGGRCAECLSTKGLEFDHIDPSQKSFSVSKSTTVAIHKWWLEIAKCQLLCEDCHQEKTIKEQSVEHGGGLTGKKNCKCQLCRTTRNAYMRKWKASKK